MITEHFIAKYCKDFTVWDHENCKFLYPDNISKYAADTQMLVGAMINPFPLSDLQIFLFR